MQKKRCTKENINIKKYIIIIITKQVAIISPTGYKYTAVLRVVCPGYVATIGTM